MADEEKLEISISGNGESAEKMLQSIADLLNGFVSGANKAVKAWDKFAGSLEGRTTSALQKTDEYVTKVNNALARTQTILAPVVGGVNSLNAALSSTARSADTMATANTKVAKATKDSAEASDTASAKMKTLTLQYSAGRIGLMDYVSGLEAVAKTAKEGSDIELEAIAKVRKARENARRDAERSAKKAVVDAASSNNFTVGGVRTAGQVLGNAGAAMTNNVTRPLIGIGEDAITAASAQDAALNRSQAIFKENAGTIDEWASHAEEGFAMSKRAALDNASSMGESLTELGVGSAKATEMSKSLVELSAKFAVLKGINPEQVLKIFQSGMAGKGMRAMKDLGIDLTAAAIKAEAYKDGIAQVTKNNEKEQLAADAVAVAENRVNVAKAKFGEGSSAYLAAHDAVIRAKERLAKASAGVEAALKPEQRAEAAYAIIAQHTATADEAFNSAQNQEAISRMRLLSVIEDTAAAYGKELIPALIQGEQILEKVFHTLENLSPSQKRFVLFLLGAAALTGPLLTGLSLICGAFLTWNVASAWVKAFPALLEAVTAKLGGVATASTAATVAETEAAEAGAAAFAITSPWGLAIAAAAGLVMGIVSAWHKVTNAQDEAAKKAKDFQDAEKDMSAKGPHHALQVQSTDLAQQISKQETAINKAQTGGVQGLAPKDLPGYISRLQAQLDYLRKQKQLVDDELAFTPDDSLIAAYGNDTSTGDEPKVPKVDPNAKGGKGNRTYKTPMPMPNFGDLQPMEALLGANPLDAATTAENYAAQADALKDRFAQTRINALQSGQPFDEDAFKKQELGHSLNLNSNAVTATESKIGTLVPQVQKDQSSIIALLAKINELKKAVSGKNLSQDAKNRFGNQFTDLKTKLDEARKVYEADSAALKKNQSVHHEALAAKAADVQALVKMNEEKLAKDRAGFLEEQNMLLKTGAASRDQYDQALRAAMERIGQFSPDYQKFKSALDTSTEERKRATDEVKSATARLVKDEFDVQRAEIASQAAEKIKTSGVLPTDVKMWQDAENGKIDHAQFTKTFGDQDEQHKANMDDGKESVAQYRTFLISMLDEAKAKFGETSVEAAKLNVTIAHLDWQQITDQARQAKDAYESGNLSVEGYIKTLEKLRASLPATSAAHKQMTETILDQDRKIVESAKEAGNEIGTTFAGVFMNVLTNVNQAGATLRNFAKELGSKIIERNVQGFVSKAALKGEEATNPKVQQAQAALKIEAQKQADAAKLMNTAADKQLQAAKAMQSPQSSGASSSGDADSEGGDDDEDYGSDDGSDSSNTAGSINAGIGLVGNAAGALKGGSNALADAGNVVETAASSGWLGKAVASAVPIVGGLIAGYSLFSNLFGSSSNRPDYTSHAAESASSSMGRGDHTGMFDSGYSGSASLRALLSESSAKTAGANRPSQTVTFHPGSIVIQGAGQHANAIVQELMGQINNEAAIQNALMPTGT